MEFTLPVTSDYELLVVSDRTSVLAGELFNIELRGGGQRLYYEVGKLCGHFAIGDGDAFRSHWKVTILFHGTRGDVEQLPDAIIRSLIERHLCAPPIWAQVYRGEIATVLDGYGDIMCDD